jgi:hypothetical protein
METHKFNLYAIPEKRKVKSITIELLKLLENNELNEIDISYKFVLYGDRCKIKSTTKEQIF